MFASVMVAAHRLRPDRHARARSRRRRRSATSSADAPFVLARPRRQRRASEVLRITALVAAAAACATAILGWYVRKPDRSARLALSALRRLGVRLRVPGRRAGRIVRRRRCGDAVDDARSRVVRDGRWTPPPPAAEKDARDSGTGSYADRSGRLGAAAELAVDASRRRPRRPRPPTRPFGEPPTVSPANPYGQPYPQGSGPAARSAGPAAADLAAAPAAPRPTRRDGGRLRHHRRHRGRAAGHRADVVRDRRPRRRTC